MRVRVYVDGFNLYYGGKAHAQARTLSPSWKWLDVRALAERVIGRRWEGRGAYIDHITYCTARITGSGNAGRRQEAYLEALRRSGAINILEKGRFVERYVELPLAARGVGDRPELERTQTGGLRMVGVSRREEKGSDVNVATHLVADAFQGRMDAAVVISNDSDLALPIRMVRARMPVGTINPQPGRAAVANALRPTTGTGTGHWYDQLVFDDLLSSQLPHPCAGIARPHGW